MTQFREVWVHAWEYIEPGNDSGGGGFDWFERPADARNDYDAEGRPEPGWGHFLFPVRSNKTGEDLTNEVDADLIDHCAAARIRKIDPQLLEAWNRLGYSMGQKA